MIPKTPLMFFFLSTNQSRAQHCVPVLMRSVLRGLALGASGGPGREALAYAVADIVDLIADLAADFFAAGGSEQQGCANANAYASYESQHIADGVIFARVKVLRLVTQIGHAVGGSADAVGNALPDVAGEAVGLVEKINRGLQNGSN